jgi:pimeloyl-ACP methyl ester carboxylesterase
VKRACVFLTLVFGAGALQTPAPAPPSADQKREIERKIADLSACVDALRAKHADAALVADVDVYRKAAENILRFPEEFATPAFVGDTVAVLDKGIARARELERGAASWPSRKGHVVRAYVSKLDGTVQPYGLTIPDSYDGTRPMRLDIWQHGTNRTLNEVAFITQQESDRAVPAGQDYIQLEPLGRTNVSYRWAGEADLFESLASVMQRYNVDRHRIVLRGFSMGGASSWHLGLHHPGMWAAIEAGAGYTETRRYGHRDNLPPYQEAMLHYYDAVDYSLNAYDTPTVGYGGEIDAQLQASVNIREQLTKEGFRFQPDGPFRWVTDDLRALFLVGPKTGHAWHPDSKAQSEAFIVDALKAADAPRTHVRFVTYTTRFNKAHWLSVKGLEATYQRADVNARRNKEGREYFVETKNVTALKFENSAARFTIDGQALKAGPNASFEKSRGKWALASAPGSGLRKVHGLQGPVDDAFMDAFLCVRPTGTAWNQVTSDWAAPALETFRQNFAKWLRGDIRIKDDRSVTPADIADNNLILFGDPGSNGVLARIVDKLPIGWSRTTIAVGPQKFSAPDHVPVLIYPNPLNPKRYVVVNSGHTFGDADFRGTNAWLYPRLGDYAVLKPNGDVVISGFFDERWQLKSGAATSARTR